MRRLAVIACVLALPLAFLTAATDSSAQTGDVIQTTPWACTGPVDIDLLRVTVNSSGADAISFGTGCTGRIGRIECRVTGADCVKVQNASANAAHDLDINGGFIICEGKNPASAHQDGVQVMGGRSIHFDGVYIGGCDTQGLFINRAGSNATTPTDIVFSNGKVGLPSPDGGPATPVNINVQVNSRIENSVVCRSPRFGNAINTHGNASASVNNTILPVGDPGCDPDVTSPPPPPPPPTPEPPPPPPPPDPPPPYSPACAPTCDEQIVTLKSTLLSTEQALTAMQREVTALNAALENRDRQIIELNAEIAVKSVEITRLNAVIDALLAVVDKAAAEQHTLAGR